MSAASLPLPAASPVLGTTRRAPSAFRIFLRETRFEFLRLLRTRAFSLSVIGFPVMFYVLFGLVLNRGVSVEGVSVARYLLAGYAVFGAVGAALFGVGVQLSAELSAGWLELKRASPMPASAYLAAKMCTAMAFGVLIVAVLLTLGHFFAGATFTVAETGRIFGLTLLGSVPFSLLGIVVALLVPANSAPGITNLLYLPMSFLGGLWLPISQLPVALQHFAVALPTYHMAQLMLSTLGYGGRGNVASHLLYLLGFTALFAGVARLLFHRREVSA